MTDKTFRLSPSDIDTAFERNEFRVVFQPKVDLASERMTGAEVFVRWQHAQYGLLPPGLFLDFIEAQGRMPDLTGFVFHAALEGARQWRARGKDWAVSINVAPVTVTSHGFGEGLARLLEEYAIKPGWVIVEVPERAVAQDPVALCDALFEVREMGVNVALDGGGIVPVDLAQMARQPFTSVKLGGPASIRLAQRLGLRGKGAIAARLRFANQHGLEAVAVGAEDEATTLGLVDVGFSAAQGIWIQKPLPLEELLSWDGTWARGNVSIEPMMTPPSGSPVKAAWPEPKTAPRAHGDREAGKPHLQTKPQSRVQPIMQGLEPTDVEDIVEDEETAAPVKREGFGTPVEGCPPMNDLVQRRKGNVEPAPRN